MAKGLNHYSLNQMYEMEYKELVQAIETTLFDAWDSKESYEYLLSNGEGIPVSIAENQKKNWLED